MKRVCIFCGSNVGARPSYAASARAIARLLAARGIGIVYGGGNVGLMGVIADAALEAGGEVIGVIPDGLVARELAHRGLTRLHVVGSMHERKAIMADLSDAFIALPGGFGTFEEFCEAVTWTQLGIHAKPCALLNVDGYYDPLLALFDLGVREQFIRAENRRIVVASDDPSALIEALEGYRPPAVPKWIGRDER
jgi:uncharacterized protein (TIGR00730 family)